MAENGVAAEAAAGQQVASSASSPRKTPLVAVARACLELAGSEEDDRPGEALADLKQCEEDDESTTAELIDTASMVARWFEDNQAYEDLLPFQRKLVGIVEGRDGINSTGYATVLHTLADCLNKLGQYKEAEDSLSKALTIRSEVFGCNHTKVAFTLNSLAGLYTEQGKFDDATPLTQRSLEIFSGEMLASVQVKCLDDGRRFSLSDAVTKLPKTNNPIELHSVEEILDTCEVRNLDTGNKATMKTLTNVADKTEDPMALRDVEDALATMVIRNIDTGEVMTMDQAGGAIVPSTFAPTTRRSSMPNIDVGSSLKERKPRGSLKGKFKKVFGSGRRKSEKKKKVAEAQAHAERQAQIQAQMMRQRSGSNSSARRPSPPKPIPDPRAVTSLPSRRERPSSFGPAAQQQQQPVSPPVQLSRPINVAFVPSYAFTGDVDDYEQEEFDGD